MERVGGGGLTLLAVGPPGVGSRPPGLLKLVWPADGTPGTPEEGLRDSLVPQKRPGGKHRAGVTGLSVGKLTAKVQREKQHAAYPHHGWQLAIKEQIFFPFVPVGNT